ncbi:unnamed protein product [Discula destructiva]
MSLPTTTPVVEDRAARPQVAISPSSTVVGITSVFGKVEKFPGIPFADPPTGNLRLRPPQKLTTSLGSAFDAALPAAACPQMLISTAGNNFITDALGELLQTPLFQEALNVDEDCLTVSVMRPAGTPANASLPVFYWIFGGAFELGWAAMYDAEDILTQAIEQDQPFVFVAVNYRVAGFGFMPGKEILADGAANLGLLDQRMGLEWVADNIEAFGGDPEKVTIWGESAGSISVFDQMALYGGDNMYKGKPLFRGAIMNSGSITPTENIDSAKAQAIYDTVAAIAGCTETATTTSLDCLRAADYPVFLSAINSVPGILSYTTTALSFLPRPDGVVLPASPDVLAEEGRYAAVPMIIGNQRDEGTLLALFTGNVTTTDDLLEYLSTVHFQQATMAQLEEIVGTYPTDIRAGSPFGTGILNELYPQYKRIAAIMGDLVFTLARRLFLETAEIAYPNVPSWSYISTFYEDFPIMGSFHASDILEVFFGLRNNYASNSIRTYYFNFLYNLDPNNGTGQNPYPDWPQWKDTGNGHQLMENKADTYQYTADTFRGESYEAIKAHAKSLYV